MAVFSSGMLSLRSLESGTQIPNTINGIIQSADSGKICVYPTVEGAAKGYDVFTADETGLKQALYSLYQKGSGDNYVIYIGANVASATNDSHIGMQGVSSPASHTQMTLTALEGKVNTLYFIGHANDAESSTTAAPSLASTLTLSQEQPIYAGCNIVFRNIKFKAGTIYMGGNSLDLARGAYMDSSNAFNIYGGMPSGSSSAKEGLCQINITSAGNSSALTLVGGNEQGSFTGNVEFNLNHMGTNTSSSNKFTLYGGSLNGTHNGGTAINIGDGITALGAYSTATIIGGNAAGTHEGDVSLSVLGTNTGSSAKLIVYGGNLDGTHTGNFTAGVATISNLGTATFVGGNSAGTFNGDSSLNITSAGQASKLVVYGGGEGVLGSRVDSKYTYTGEFNGNSTVNIDNTGSVSSSVIYGAGLRGTFNGNTDVQIGTTSGDLELTGGLGEVGVVNGNVSAKVLKTTGSTKSLKLRGGGFSSSDKPITINGNVTTVLEDIGSELYDYYGGLEYGDITGSISNKLISKEGSGARFHLGTTHFYGGSKYGNIGTKGVTTDAIHNEVDFTGFTGNTHWIRYVGANERTGFVYGNITNLVTAGGYLKGGVDGFSGGGGISTTNSSGTNVDNISIDPVTKKRTINSAGIEALSAFRVYGDITNHLYKGCFSSGGDAGYARGAGYGGYIEGNITTHVGEKDLAYGRNKYMEISSNMFSTTDNDRGHDTGWDIVGGGGSTGRGEKDRIYIKGNCTLQQYYSLARWTYGGGFGGVIEGNTHNELHFGIVDTLEGGGYATHLIKGNTSAYIHNGQIDYFLTGGAWDDATIDGNTFLQVDDGVVNGSLSGYYGYSSDCLLTGNTDVLIKGGDYSGKPRAGVNAFTGGMARQGTILGNIRMTLDFRTPDGKPDTSKRAFKLPHQMFICGGRPFGKDFSSVQNWNLGASEENWIELNIYSNTGEDILAGAYIYGDGGGGTSDSVNGAVSDSNALNNCKSGKITINIDAPGSTIGTLYATSYKIGTSTGIQKDITINLVDAKTVGGLNGGCVGDKFTNDIAGAKPENKATINVGYYPDPDDPRWDINDAIINVGSNGFNNFTNLNVSNKLLMVNENSINGSIRNGVGALAGTHKASFSKFGHTLLEHNGGIGITGSTINPFISIGNLTVKGVARLVSPAGENRVLLTDFIPLPDDEGIPALLEWTKNNTASTITSNGTWFGARPAYRVLTFTDGGENAKAMTPLNFVGINEADGKTYIGDNDVTTSPNKYAIAIPGSFVDADVRLIDEADGWVKHDVANVSDSYVSGVLTLPISVYGNVKADTPTKMFRLAIPAPLSGDEPILPTVEFLPERTETESWIKEISIECSKKGSDGLPTVEIRTEKADGNPDTWKSPDHEYSYNIVVTYTNKAEVFARNIILKVSEAKALQNVNNVVDIMNATGRPFFGHNISQEMIAAITEDLGQDVYMRVHPVQYRAGIVKNSVPTENYVEMTANIVVVPDTDIDISADQHTALYAHNASLNVTKAAELTGQQDLDDGYTKAMVIHSDGTTGTPDINASAISDIKAVEYTTTVPVKYTYTREGESSPLLTRDVKVLVLDNYICKIDSTGYLTLSEAIDAANGMPAAKDIVIQMLVDDYNREGALEINGRKVTLTTAKKTDAHMPYKGERDAATITFGPGAEPADNILLVKNAGMLAFTGITLDGTGLGEADAPVSFIKAEDTSSIKLLAGASVQNFTATGAVIHSPHMLEMTECIVQNNTTQGNTGVIYANGTFNFNNATVSGNKAAKGGGIYADTNCVLTIQSGNISGNIVSEEGGGIYHSAKNLYVSGKVYVFDNMKVNATYPEGVRNNVYLHETSTAEPYKKMIEIKGALTDGSVIGVMTDKSANNSGKGVIYTVVAVPTPTCPDLKDASAFFTHDQLNINEKAYQVILDQRTGGKNLVLGLNGAIDFTFQKVDATNKDNVLPGAEFVLYKCDNDEHNQKDLHVELVTQELLNEGGCWQPVMDDAEPEKQRVYTSDENGVVDFDMLPNGSYVLVETQAPNGFSRPTGQWRLKIDNTKAHAQRISITGLGEMLPPAFARNEDPDGQEFLLPNMPEFAVNPTGGGGIYPMLAAGCALIITSIAYFIWSKKKEQAGLTDIDDQPDVIKLQISCYSTKGEVGVE